MTDRLAKEATQNHHITYSRLPKSALQKDIRKESIRKWQKHLEETTKGAITKEFFSSVESRLAVNLQLSSNITTIRPPLWSSGQSFWIQIQRSRVRFPALPVFSE